MSTTAIGAADPKLPKFSRYCKCTACGLYFTNDRPFQKHRLGEMSARRCRTAPELAEKGLFLNAKGYWAWKPKWKTWPAQVEA